MEYILLTPPVVFIIYLIISYLISNISRINAAKGEALPYKEEPYACGEDVAEQRIQPDYNQFFPFAFFFTIMHVVSLVISTAPPHVIALPLIYLITALVAIFILFRR